MRLKGWIWFIGILVILNTCIALFGRQYRFDSILIHHSAGRIGDLAMIRSMHEKRGWSDAAYHLILSNGSTAVPSGHLEASGRFSSLSYSGATRNHEANVRSLHLCVVGNYEANEVPESLRPPLAHALLALCDDFSIPPERIIFHRDVNNTVCPGKHLTKDEVKGWMKNLAKLCPDSVKQQHLDVIASSSLSLSSYPHGLLVVNGCVSIVFSMFWFGMVLAFRSSKRSRSRSTRPRNPSRTPRRKRPKRNRHR